MLRGSGKVRSVAFALVGASILVLKGHYTGPLEEFVYAYAGNFGVSFALYFATVPATQRYKRSYLASALITLLAVSAFELSDGFGFMTNVYDPADLLANAAGIGFAVAVDLLCKRLMNARAEAAT